MTEIVFKPERAPVVNGRGLYRAHMNRKPLDLLFRAKNAGEADAMLQYLFAEQTRGKTLMVTPEMMQQTENANGKKEDQTAGTPEDAEDAEDAETPEEPRRTAVPAGADGAPAVVLG